MLCDYFLHSLDLLGTVIFAASGALLAYEERRNGLVALLYAVLTAIGGGTLRDILLMRPIFWLRSPAYLLLSISTGLLVFVLVTRPSPTLPKLRRHHLWLPDAISLAVFTVVGTQIGSQFILQSPPYSPLLSVALPPMLGLMTGVGGGIARDICSRKVPDTIQNPYYALASIVGGSLYCLMMSAQMPPLLALGIAITSVTLILRPAFKEFFCTSLNRWYKGDRIFAETTAKGKGGNITINASKYAFFSKGVQGSAPIIADLTLPSYQNNPNGGLAIAPSAIALALASGSSPDNAGNISAQSAGTFGKTLS